VAKKLTKCAIVEGYMTLFCTFIVVLTWKNISATGPLHYTLAARGIVNRSLVFNF
jgi:hypothetical protein